MRDHRDPLPQPHPLTHADMEDIIHKSVGVMRNRHTKTTMRHTELDMGERPFIDLGHIGETYAAYRLGFDGKTETDVVACYEVLRKEIDPNFANFLGDEVCDSIDWHIGEKLAAREKAQQGQPATVPSTPVMAR